MAIAHLYINGYIGADMFDPFIEGNSFSVKQLNEFLSAMPADTEELIVHINSGGGSVTEGFAIHDILKAQNIRITTVIEGLCGSIATVIAMAGSVRKMHQNSEYFIHNPAWIPGGPNAHTADDLEKLTSELRKAEERLIDFYYKNTKANKSDIIAKMQAETTLTAHEAKALGFITEIIQTDVTAMVKYRIAAYVEPKIKNNNMSEIKIDASGFEKALDAFSKKFEAMFKKGKIVNATATLADGKTVYYDGELAVGTKIWLDETMTEAAPDGDHTLDNGTVITTANGEVTQIAEPQDSQEDVEVTALKALIAALEAEKETLTAKLETKTKELDTVNADVTELQKQFTAFKKAIETGGKGNFKTDNPDPKPKPAVTATGFDKAAEAINAKIKRTKENY